MREISSKHNAKFKIWLSLLEAKGIKHEGLALVGGAKIVAELSQQQPERIVEWIVPPKGKIPDHPAPATRLPAELFQVLDVVGTRSTLAVMKCPQVKSWSTGAPKGLQLVVALSDPHNLGALVRSAEAFGAESVILTKESASPFLPRSIRASSGSVFRVPLLKGPSLHELNLTHAFGLDLGGRNIYEQPWPRDLYLVLGEEGQGLPETLAVTRVTIPMSMSVESLNAVAAASVGLFSYRQRHPLVSK